LYWAGNDCGYPAAWPHCHQYPGVSARFYASAEYLALFRDAIHPEPVVAPIPQFGGDFASGVLTTIGMEVAPEYRLEVTYFGAHSWSGSSLLNNVPVSYSAQLSNTEVTLRHHLVTRPAEFEISFLIGARILDIEDDLFLPQVTETDNELIGLQAGGLAQVLVGPRSWIDWEVKGAIADNTADVTGLGEENVTSFLHWRDVCGTELSVRSLVDISCGIPRDLGHGTGAGRRERRQPAVDQ
jgi:hypothetical protein